MAKDRIKNYAQGTSEINILKDIRTDLSVTPSSYTPDTSTVTRDRLVTFAQAEEELVVLGDIEKGVKQQVVKGDIADKRITNIEKLLQGNLYDYQTDSSSAYTKSVPSGAMPYAGLESLGGKTVVMNQLIQNGNFADSTGWKSGGTLSVTDNEATVSRTTTTFVNLELNTGCKLSLIENHKYFISAILSSSAGTAMHLPGGGASEGTTSFSGITSKTKCAYIYQCTRTSDTFAMAFRFYVTKSGTEETVTATVSNYMCVDLTLMFGAGNEPSTVAEFEAMFPADYYEYNEGTLLSAGVTDVVSQGYNLFDKSTAVLGRFVNDNNISAPADDSAHSDYIAVSPSQTYFLSSNKITGRYRWFEYDTNKNFIGRYSNHTSGAFTVGSRTCYIRFNMLLAELDTCVFNVSNASDGTYKPYKAPFTYPIPASIQALEGYGWSAGNYYNYVDFERKVFVQNVGRVDLGTLGWIKDKNIHRFNYDVALAGARRPSSSDVRASILCALYQTIIANDQIDMSVAMNTSGYLRVYDENKYTNMTPAEFKTAMSGVYLYYELAEPIETDISQYLTDDNLISVESGGTLTFENQHGTDYQIPVPSEETYMIDLQSAIGG